MRVRAPERINRGALGSALLAVAFFARSPIRLGACWVRLGTHACVDATSSGRQTGLRTKRCLTGIATHGPSQVAQLGATALADAPATTESQEEESDITDVLADVEAAVAGAVKKSEGKLRGLQGQVKDPAEAAVWQNQGDMLMSAPKGKWRRGLTEIEVPDWSQLDEEGNAITMRIELDPEKDFQQNAKLLFKKAKKIKRAGERLGPLIAEFEKELDRWEETREQIDAWKSEQVNGALSDEAVAGVRTLYDEMVTKGIIKRPVEIESVNVEKAAKQAFKRKYGKDIDCFRSPGGHEVICGRSSTTNEYVSLKLAKGDLVWFHTANRIPGAHVLIKAPWDTVGDEDIEFAAKIAAYHSKSKNARHVPVTYCRGEQVRKIKNTPRGQVTINGNTCEIFVDPELPDDASAA